MDKSFIYARTCYDHIAGIVGTSLFHIGQWVSFLFRNFLSVCFPLLLVVPLVVVLKHTMEKDIKQTL